METDKTLPSLLDHFCFRHAPFSSKEYLMTTAINKTLLFIAAVIKYSLLKKGAMNGRERDSQLNRETARVS